MMIEFLEEIDRQIVVAINSLHNPILDEIMWWVSARITWIPLYIALLYLAYKKLNKKQLFLYVVVVISAVALADLISVHFFKNVFLRYRPSHNLLIGDQLHFYQIKPGEWYKGGEYGFISSHAANYFAIATFVFLVLRKYYSKLIWYLLGIGILIGFSRIYLGVHYLSDVLAGFMVGTGIAIILYKLVFIPLSTRIK